MICQNCHASVDNDLIFCTTCGERLSGTVIETPTVLQNGSTANNLPLAEKPKTSSSNLKWITLIIALIAIPATIFGVVLLINSSKTQVSQNPDKPNTPAPSPTRKTNASQNSNANVSNTNTNSVKSNTANVNESKKSSETADKKVIVDKRIEIYAKSSYSMSFEVEADTAKILGEVKVLEGEKIEGFVYTQEAYNEHFPDPIYKMFSFEGVKTAELNQTLIKEEYVLIFVNNTEETITIQSKFSIE